MFDVETVVDLVRGAVAVAVAAAAALLAVWLWKETRRPVSVFTEQETKPTRFDRLTDRAATLVAGGIESKGHAPDDDRAKFVRNR